MLFGAKPTYLYGEIHKDKFSIPTKAFKIEPLTVECSRCPAKLVNDKVEIFFKGPIFNTYVLSVEEKLCILKGYDDKLTIIKEMVEKGKLYTVKIIKEDEKKRVVEIFKNDELFPGYTTYGTLEVLNNSHIIHTKKAKGPIVLQNNEQKDKTECLLYKIDNEEYYFVEINNPVERCTVKVVKSLNLTKIVENGNIKGIVIDCKSKKNELEVYAKRVCLGTYIFIEDLQEGSQTVEILGKKGKMYTVICKGFIGTCSDEKVNKIMKGFVYDIKGGTFKFTQSEDMLPSKIEAAKEAHKNDSQVKNDSKPVKRTNGFEEVVVSKKIKINSESEIENDQLKAIEYIKNQASKKTNVLPIFNKYILMLKEKDYLCLFYLQYLNENKLLTNSEISKMIKITSDGFLAQIVTAFNDLSILEMIYKKKKTKKCFIKLLALVEDKVAFIKQNGEYMDSAVEFIYKNISTPRVVVETVINNNFKGWIAYLKNEEGNYKRGLFRRAVLIKFKQAEIKDLFKLWMEFEEQVNGNIEEVREQAKLYVENTVKTE